MIAAAVEELTPVIGTAPACRVMGMNRATVYRRRRPQVRVVQPRPRPARALTDAEQNAVLEQLHAPRFVDQPPAQVYATLLDEGTYLASERTMYRLLAENRELRERRNQLRRPAYARPELLATAPNQLWSWDITKLRGPERWVYYYLYVVLDVFSRYVVGWTLAHREGARIAEALIAEAVYAQGITPGTLTIHADRGGAMRSKTVAQLLCDLEIFKSHSRPHTSNDNPFSEAQFKTLKYRPTFPARFGCIQHGRQFCGEFFPWYNAEHHHSSLGLHTPRDVHYGLADGKRDARAAVLSAAYAAHPERFVRKPPQPPALPTAVWINAPIDSDAEVIAQ